MVLLAGCSVSRANLRRADAILAATTPHRLDCARPDHCAADSPLLDAADRALAASTAAKPVNVVTLLDDSEAALAARISLIRAARRSIDVQTYIWDEDDVGLLMLDELIAAARRGVRVRILVDQLDAFTHLATLDELARVHANLQVKLYNPTFDEAQPSPLAYAASVLCCFMKFNQRMHNKLLLVDDAIGITGGRNYQDRYFNWDDQFDYLDREVMVGGAVAAEMAHSFQVFWNHRRSVPLVALRDVNRAIRAHPAALGWPAPRYADPQRVADVQDDAEDPAWLARWLGAISLRTADVNYFSDYPAKTDDPQVKSTHEFTTRLMHLVADARHEVLLQTPYLVMSRRAQKIFRRLHAEADPPRIIVSTNSLASTDAFAVYALSYKHRKRYLVDFGFQIYEMKPHAADAAAAYALANGEDDDDNRMASGVGNGSSNGQDVSRDVRAAGNGNGDAPAAARHRTRPRWVATEARRGLFGRHGSGARPAPLRSSGRRYGLHAKSIVIDDDVAMVGSHNFDPRSDHYNTEGGVIVYDPRFAAQLRASILRSTLPQNAWLIAPREPVVPVLTDINQAIGSVSEQLPLFDLWPFRYATDFNYTGGPGCTPMAPNNPRFYGCYTMVGDFPDVAISPKWLITRFITAFGAGVKGIL